MPLKILLIDNSQAIKKVFSLSLKGYDYNLQTASEPETALALIQSFQPQLIFIDSLTQNLQISDFIKQCHQATKSPIILLKSNFLETTKELKNLINSKIVTKVLEKPFQKQTLREVVHPFFYNNDTEDSLDIPIALDPIVKWESRLETESTEIQIPPETEPTLNPISITQKYKNDLAPDAHTSEQLKKIITDQLNLFFKQQSQNIITKLATPIVQECVQEYVQQKIKILAKSIIEKEIQKMLNSSDKDLPPNSL